MTPGARISAAIEILDRILAGNPAQVVLSNWARANRYAGSGDRAAIRDHVFDGLRCRSSYGFLGGGADGRALMVGWVHASAMDHNILFSGDKYAPKPLSGRELSPPDLADAPDSVRLDCPAWLLERFEQSLGPEHGTILRIMQSRAPLFLRINLARTDRGAAIEALEAEGIRARPHGLSDSALKVTGNPRRVAQSAPYRQGLVEIQDAASQAVVDFLPLADGMRVLDFCAGGGGKSLAMAARAAVSLTAHDLDQGRMKDLPARARRAGVAVGIAGPADIAGGGFDLVLCDVPCSGSGAWRRTPEAKWRLGPEKLREYMGLQAEILADAARHVAPGGWLAYVTCSLLESENLAQVRGFCRANPRWRLEKSRRFTPIQGGDGFFVALLKRV